MACLGFLGFLGDLRPSGGRGSGEARNTKGHVINKQPNNLSDMPSALTTKR